MSHFALMVLFAGLVAVSFSLVARESSGKRLRYGLKIFCEFVGVGLILSWLMYLLP
jgi:hypothetical protein